MQFELKPIAEESIPEALAKAERYRFLSEPGLAESICLDILAVAPDHQQALASLLLALTDQFDSNVRVKTAQEVLGRIRDAYEHDYYAGILWERLGNARLRQRTPGAGPAAYRALREAMNHYERAIHFAAPRNDDAVLRWNTCARLIMQNPEIEPPAEEGSGDAWVADQTGSRIADA